MTLLGAVKENFTRREAKSVEKAPGEICTSTSEIGTSRGLSAFGSSTLWSMMAAVSPALSWAAKIAARRADLVRSSEQHDFDWG